ncbi:MAG: sensor domain-containing diguanylate cyclase, partial [bacterium]|nr:sensor domain-containing diguanylate cyclase [bacterium]
YLYTFLNVSSATWIGLFCTGIVLLPIGIVLHGLAKVLDKDFNSEGLLMIAMANEKFTTQLVLLNTLGRKFALNLDLEKLFAAIYIAVREVLEAEVFFVALYDNRTEEIDWKYSFEVGERLAAKKAKLNDGPTSKAIITGKPFLSQGPASLIPGVVLLGNAAFQVQSVLMVPIFLHERVIGVISVQSYTNNRYGENEVKLLEIIGSQAAMAIHNAQLYEKTLRLSLTDSLTGLDNARSLLEKLQAAIEKAVANGMPLSLVMIDSDSLKIVNDRFGHLVGDQHLLSLSQIIRATVREEDLVVRYAGDEFIVLMENVRQDEAAVLAERVVRAVRDTAHEYAGQEVSITVSAGVASFPKDAFSAETLIKATDRAMYEAKIRGKDQVACFE